ncbi:ATP-binding protein [Mesobacillus maritimus]|uniref:histidine kinase n=1 Tax=Mesobacillus maritimus TaxID=1643336 RepID=A0ABS7K3F8_9BACI|nr:ATP-binding protein [Mesobacillus maritimus]MBY0096650.1 response regulator [Mesobacillus maritimus]
MDNQMVNILLVDDREENLLALEAVLTSPNYRLIKAHSGSDALKCILREEFAVIIMDVQMPDMNGFETAKMIRKREKSKDVPIIFVTALSQTNENVMQGYSVGAIDYIIKPFDPTILKCKVNGFVSLFLNQKKVEEQAKIIIARTRELEEANQALKKNEEMLEALVIKRTDELTTINHKLLESEEKYRRLVEESPEAIILTKQSHEKPTFVNQTAVKLLKAASKEEVQNRSLFDYVHPEDHNKVRRIFLENREGHNIYECRILTLNEEILHVEVKSIPFDYQGEPCLHILVRDITELKQSREYMHQTEKLTVVGELAAGIAHEIRNPLTSLKGFTQLLGDKIDSNQDYMDIMITEIERINTIVSELLLLAKPRKLDFKELNIGIVLKKIITLMEAQANLYGVKIKCNDCEEIPSFIIHGEENKLKQVFINLLKNAIEAMQEGGEITISVQRREKDVEIKFIDGGSGIAPEVLSKIGQPFFTTKEKGTGLGLMVCYSIVESHQGKMDIDSKSGEGTTVSILLPLYQTKENEIEYTT